MPDEIVFNISEKMYQQLIEFQETLAATENIEQPEVDPSLRVSEEMAQKSSSMNSEALNQSVD